MNLQIVRPGESPAIALMPERGADALLVPSGADLPAKPVGTKLFVTVDAVSPGSEPACLDSAGAPSVVKDHTSLTTTSAQRAVACPNHKLTELLLDERVKEAARLAVDGVVLDAPDAWYSAGARGAGFGASCE